MGVMFTNLANELGPHLAAILKAQVLSPEGDGISVACSEVPDVSTLGTMVVWGFP